MFGHKFYWASLRKINAVIGNLFNDIWIQRQDADGNVVKTFKVPIEQAQKEGYLVRLREEEKKEDSPGIGITLPRLSYEFTGMQYNTADKQYTSGYIRQPKADQTSTGYKMYNPVPYVVGIDMSLYAKNIDDALQILEQILPFFGPQIGLTINEIPELGLKNDITIRLDGFNTNVDYEGNIGDGRLIVWTLNFSVYTRIFHPVKDVKVIKQVIENIHGAPDEAFTDMIITQTVNPITADKNDVYTIDYVKQEFDWSG
jgi:hypothetical protein